MTASQDPRADCLARYVDFFETLTADTVDRLPEVAVAELRFRDPFNDIVGRDKVAALLRQMFDDIDDPAFHVTDVAWGRDRAAAYLRWRMTGRIRRLGAWTVDGMSEIRFAPDGRVAVHFDHWDAAGQFYEKWPLLGPLLRAIRRRLARI